MTLNKEELRWFGVWNILPTGECACPKGLVRNETSRDQRTAVPGSCVRPGKHPWALYLEDGQRVGFPHGFKDALPWADYWPGIGRSVVAGGGRSAAAVPGNLWVLDVDSDRAWRGLVRLVQAGALEFSRVAAADLTPRGWHVWVRAEQDGWRTGQAQKHLNQLLDQTGAPRGLEVKSGGGYVVMPDGLERRWTTLEALADRLTWSAGLSGGWGSRRRVAATAQIGAGEPPKAYAENPATGANGLWEMWGEDERKEWSRGSWNNLEVAAARLHSAPEGTRNNALNRAAYIEGRAAVREGWERSAVEKLLVGTGVAIGLTEAEVKATVHSGLGDA